MTAAAGSPAHDDVCSPGSSRSTLVRLIVFPGGFNWPVWVAQSNGWFREHGIDVEVTPTPGSVHQLTHLIDGRYDVAITLVDNVIAYREGQGEVAAVGPDLFAFMAADTRVLPTLVTLPEVRTYQDLRGKALSLDARTTGYALVLKAMLAHGGLAPGDYTLDSIGGAQERYLDMRARRHAGCLLNAPFERLLEAEGFNLLDNAGDVIGAYQGQVAAARRAWADAHPHAVVGFARAFLRSVRWLYAPCNHTAALDLYRANVPGATEQAARTAHAALFDPVRGLPDDGRVDPAALRNVIALRARFGTPARDLGVPADYYEDRFVEAANRLLG